MDRRRALIAAAALVVAVAAVHAGCGSRRNPAYCCASAADCDFDEDIPICEDGFVCVDHSCVASADASPVDAAPGACETAGGVIVFASDRDGDYDIATVLADGSGYVALTVNATEDNSPSWSPDGTMIAWLSGPSLEQELFVMNADGSDQHNVSDGDAADFRWSRDSRRLVFHSDRDGNAEIYVVDADGSNLTNLSMNPAVDRFGDWSADGSRIVFASTRDGSPAEIYSMGSNGENVLRLTDSTGTSGPPRWSPTGSAIAWSYFESNPMLWTMTANGANETMIATVLVGTLGNFEWSPDGSRIAYGGGNDVRVVTADGGTDLNLTSGSTAYDGITGWSPDGSHLVIETQRDGNREVYVIGADGSNPTNVSDDPGDDRAGSWAACP